MDDFTPCRIVMLTNSTYGLLLLEKLEGRGVSLSAIVIETRFGIRDNLKKSDFLSERLKEVPKAVYRSLRNVWRTQRVKSLYQSYSERVIITGPLDSEHMLSDLRRLAPDFIVLGGAGILKPHLIATARHGVLNAHPGLLPWIRGTGVIGRAIERGIPVGATCHYVNAGIDLGRIIERRLLPVTGKENLQELEINADDLATSMMADLITEQIMRGREIRSIEQVDKFSICKWLSPAERLSVDESVRKGEAKRLFEEWAPFCVNQKLHTLPLGFRGLSKDQC